MTSIASWQVGEADKSTFIQALIDRHFALFDLSPEQVRASAEWRVLAASTVDLITSKTSTDVEGDWAKLEELCWLLRTSVQEMGLFCLMERACTPQPVQGPIPPLTFVRIRFTLSTNIRCMHAHKYRGGESNYS